MKYYFLKFLPNTVIRAEDNASIPFDEANNDYQDYLKWVAEGNVAKEITNGN
jgi:hypothetical protein